MSTIRRLQRLWRLLKLQSDALGWMPDLEPLGPLDDWLARHVPKARRPVAATTLDLGCGAEPFNPFAAPSTSGVDVRDDLERNVRQGDLATGPIPFGDAQFDYVTARDFIEHVPRVIYLPERRLPFVELMNEVFRVLKPGGYFLSLTPAFPFGPAFQDPTHVNIITDRTFVEYFDTHYRFAAMYGFRGGFEIVAQAVESPKLISLLRKPL